MNLEKKGSGSNKLEKSKSGDGSGITDSMKKGKSGDDLAVTEPTRKKRRSHSKSEVAESMRESHSKSKPAGTGPILSHTLDGDDQRSSRGDDISDATPKPLKKKQKFITSSNLDGEDPHLSRTDDVNADDRAFQIDELPVPDPDDILTADASWARREGYDLRWDKQEILLKDLDQRGGVSAERSKPRVHKRREGHKVDSNSVVAWKM